MDREGIHSRLGLFDFSASAANLNRVFLPSLAVAVDVGGLRALAEPGAPLGVEQSGVVVQTLGHLVANDVHKALEHSLQCRTSLVTCCQSQGDRSFDDALRRGECI